MVVGLTWRFHCQDQVEPLVRKLRSCNLVVKKKKEKKRNSAFGFQHTGLFYIFIFIFFNFFFFPFIFINWQLITILQWCLPYTDMNQPWINMCSSSRSPLPPPSPPDPSGSSQCTRPEHLSHASSLGW